MLRKSPVLLTKARALATRGRRSYEEAIKLLSNLRTLMFRLGRADEVDDCFVAVRVEYKRKSNFIRLLVADEAVVDGASVKRVPIPNTEVKPACTPAALRRRGPRAGADGTARVTVWESRKSPELFKEARSVEKPQRAFCCAVEDPAEQQDSFDEFQLSQTDSNCLASQLKLPRDIQ